MSDLEKEFVEASVALEEREAAEQEEQRQRELEQARALAEAERQRAEAERKQAEGRQRLQRRIIGGLAAFLAVALILAVFAFQQRQEALRQHGIAEAENQKTLEAEKKAIKQAIIATGALEKLTTLQQRQEYERTVGHRELSKTERKMRTKTAFDSATTYLWSKQDAASLAKLVQLLKDSEDLLEDYPVVDDSWVGYVMPFVEDTTDWPLTLKYNPKQQLDHGLLQYQWRQMALNMSIQWGIPAPMRLKLQEDRTIPIADIHIIVPEPFDSQQGHAQNKNQKENM